MPVWVVGWEIAVPYVNYWMMFVIWLKWGVELLTSVSMWKLDDDDDVSVRSVVGAGVEEEVVVEEEEEEDWRVTLCVNKNDM